MTEVCKVYKEHLDKILEAQAKIPEEETVLEVADFFDALGNPTRLKILLALMEAGELCTCDLSAITKLSVSAISHQLRILKDRKIVTYRKDGKNVFYRLDDEHITEILEVTFEHMEE
ncbi:helix-turn-helix transcriptional regulator [Thermococcus sp.]|uniref:ArsR/SmtB family transcription factor n=1 Tax=Thermococcus sp. TaxID=35749 RepID=UPI00261719E8|nr:metalloregulator ArsR/SmtB family transcription factor [Thermococcus sp.]